LFFTAPHLAARCVKLLDARCKMKSYDLVVEPSAGDGVFLTLLPEDRRVGIDVAPGHPEVLCGDFLAWQPPVSAGRILTIGNPPFGQRASLALAFIEHAATFSDTIAFILPRSFNKYTFMNRVPRYFHLLDSFTCDEFCGPRGEDRRVNAVFQIWQRRSRVRALLQLPDSHPDFEMQHAHLSRTSPDALDKLRREFEFTIPQVGMNFRPRPVENVSRGSHWFIKPNVPGVKERFERADYAFIDDMNTAHKSLSKRDIIAAYTNVPASRHPADWSVEQRTRSGRDRRNHQ